MTAVVLRLGAELRLRWRSWLALGVAIGMGAGLVAALVAAAHRTQDAYGHYLGHTYAGEAYVDSGLAYGAAGPGLGRFARLPQVARSERTFLVALLSRSRSGRPIFPLGPDHVQYQVPSDDRRANTIDVPLLRRGRLPDPERADEALADTKALELLGLGVGDTLTVRVVSRDFLTRRIAELHMVQDPRSPRTASWGDLATVRIVGAEAHAKTDTDGGYVNFTPAFRRAHGGARIGAWSEELAVRLHGHAAAVPAFGDAVHAAAAGGAVGFFDPATARPVIQRTIDLLVQALRLVTLAAAGAVLLLGGQAVLRAAAAEAAAVPTLRALGMTRAQLVGLAAARGGLIAVPAVAVTAATAAALSPLAPVGWARELEPDHGFHFDAATIGITCAAVLAAVAGISAIAGLRSARVRAERGARSSRRVQALAGLPGRAGLPPAAVAGVRMAVVRRTRDATVPVRATLVSAVTAVAIVVVSLTFAHSATHLLATPRLFGQTWDYETYNGDQTPVLERAVLRDPAIQGVARTWSGPVHVGSRIVGVRATEDLRGRVDPTVLEGRAPRAPDEALVGTKTLDDLHLAVGDTVVVRQGRRAARLRIVGRGVLTSDKFNELGHGIAMRLGTLLRIAPESPTGGLLISVAPGADHDAAIARLDRLFDGTIGVRPQEVGDVGRVHGAPLLISVVFGLAAAAALAHLLLTSVRRRRRDLAILKTLGFTRGQVQAAVAWQATTIAAVGVLVGLPLGLALGRFGWNLFAEGLGVEPEAVTPVGLSLLVVPAAVLVANVIAALPARRAAGTRPALVLRAE